MTAWTVPRLLVLVQLVFISGGVVSVSAQANKSIRSYKVIEDTTVYRYPSEKSEQIALIPSGTTVHVVASQFGQWARIQSQQGRPSGYIKKSSLATTESSSSESTETPNEFPRNPQASSVRSKESRIRTEIEFNNRLSSPVAIYWVDDRGNEIFFEDLNPGSSKVFQTFTTHPWRVRDKKTGQLLKTVVVGPRREFVAIGEAAREIQPPIKPPTPQVQAQPQMQPKPVKPPTPQVQAQPQIQPKPVRPPTPQIQSEPQIQPKPSLPSRPVAVGSSPMSTFGNFLTMVLSIIVGCGVIYAIIRFTKSSSTAVDAHWATLIENLQASPKEFYASVERAIERRQVPAISNCRVDWKEGGLFTTLREYLRISRETHVLDVCGAPYGTGFFVSWWLAELQPSSIGPTLAAIWLFLSIETASRFFFEPPQNYIVTAAAMILIFLLVGILINRSSGKNWVRYVLVIPVIGWLMKRLFLPATYYRIDTASMFRSAVHSAVQEVIDEITKAKGLRALTELERKPILREFFQR
jgi:hypothetical protein